MMPEPIEIRSATPQDADGVTRLLLAQLAEHTIATPPAAVRAAVDGMLADAERGFILLAQPPGAEIIGVAYVSFIWALEHGGKSAWLEELYVVPAARSRGIGSRMLAAVLQRTSAAGCAAVDLEVDSGHARAARLYARNGFSFLPRARWVRILRGGSV